MDVVIVDDNEINVTLLRHLVKAIEDTKAITFTDSAAGLQYCLENDPDLVVIDYMMPPPDGMAFIQAFRAHPGRKNTPLLMITANQDAEVRHRALTLGASDFLTKPVDKNEFRARATNMLLLRKSQKQLADRAAWLAEEVAKATNEVLVRERETIIRLSKAAEYRNPETGAHILRMANYSQVIARNLGLSEADQTLLLDAAPMHDIGKVGTPDHILLKPGRLDPEEMDIMRQHASIGYDILKGSPSPLLQKAAVIALTHHEKFDGSGYPNNLKAQDIPIDGRIVAVADVFDALTSERPYKKAWPVDDAVKFMHENSGSHFDPVCIEAFFRNWDEIMAIKNRFTD
ncbi:MAG: response regulator [Neisseriaceae bacterium]|nr:two-component system, response regulator RpfG [Pseudomonadota bacterium]RTK99289.1 MAG: response regulator [Neisseriaceae bacterium]